MAQNIITVREFVCNDVCPGWDRVDIIQDNGWRIARSIEVVNASRFRVTCWNGDEFETDGFTPVTDWRTPTRFPVNYPR